MSASKDLTLSMNWIRSVGWLFRALIPRSPVAKSLRHTSAASDVMLCSPKDRQMKDTEQTSRTLVLIDGSHVDRLRSKLGRPIDIEKLAEFFGSEVEPATIIYYRDARDMDEYTRLRRFFDWLERHGFEVRGSRDFPEPWYQRERYGSNLVQLAIDAIDAAHQGDALAIVAGDAKLIPLFQRLDEMAVPLTLISSLSVPASIAPPPPLVELAEAFIDLNNEDVFLLAAD